jgi:hypothetical protein
MEDFLRRWLRFALISGALVTASLALGSAGYHWLGQLPWIDALLNAAMILTGMGPVDHLDTDSGKFFATAYALYSGVAFLTAAAVLFAAPVHRFLHRLHFEDDDTDDAPATASRPR